MAGLPFTSINPLQNGFLGSVNTGRDQANNEEDLSDYLDFGPVGIPDVDISLPNIIDLDHIHQAIQDFEGHIKPNGNIQSVASQVGSQSSQPDYSESGFSEDFVNDNADALNSLQGYLTMYYETGDTGWLEKYLDAMFNLSSVQSARDWEEYMSSSQYSRMFNDISAAGYNPWLALQGGIGGSSHSGVSAASSSNVNQSALSQSDKNSERSYKAQVLKAILQFAGSMIKAMV